MCRAAVEFYKALTIRLDSFHNMPVKIYQKYLEQ